METAKFEISFDGLFKLKDDLRIKTEDCETKSKEIEYLNKQIDTLENEILKLIKNKECDCKCLIIETKPIFDIIEKEKRYYSSEKQKIFDDIKNKILKSKTYTFIRLDDVYVYENEYIDKIKESLLEKEKMIDSELKWHQNTLNENKQLTEENKQLKEENKKLRDEYNWMKKLNENRRTK